MLARAMVDGESKLVLANKLDFNVQVSQVLCQFAARTFDLDDARLDRDFDVLGNNKLVVLDNVFHYLISINCINMESFILCLHWMGHSRLSKL